MNEKHLASVIGSSHVAGKYNLTDKDFLNDGADVLLEMGSRVIKLWLTPNPESNYPFNTQWQKPDSLVELCRTEPYARVFAKPFTSYLLETFPPNPFGTNFADGISQESLDYEQKAFYELTCFLMEKYQGTGKTFVLQNWETDWLLTNPDFTKQPTQTEIISITRWLNARQAGVEKARAERHTPGVTVAHCMEVNLVIRAIEGKTSAVNDIIPNTRCDLYSYSSYDACVFQPNRLREALDYLRSQAPESDLYGRDNILMGEYGAPENEFNQRELVEKATHTALEWGCKYIVYWEVFCNEPATEFSGRPSNDDMRGFWLVRPDGTKSPAYEYYYSLLNK